MIKHDFSFWVILLYTLNKKLKRFTNCMLLWSLKQLWGNNSQAGTSLIKLKTVSMSGRAGIAPLSVTVIAPQAFANFSASRNRSSFCKCPKASHHCQSVSSCLPCLLVKHAGSCCVWIHTTCTFICLSAIYISRLMILANNTKHWRLC